MMTLIVAAAVAATQPAPPASAGPQAQHEMQMQMDQNANKKGMMDCCKECCEHMAKMHEGHGSAHSERGSH